MANADKIFAFAEMIVFGLSKPGGATWTQREIDGFFYNEYLNQPLQLALKEFRGDHFGREDPPYPCAWNDSRAGDLMSPPWGIEELWITGDKGWHIGGDSSGKRYPDGPTVFADNPWQFDNFCAHPEDVYNAMVHGTPIPFVRAWAHWEFEVDDKEVPPFSLDVYSLPFGERELTRVKESYEQFYDWLYLEGRVGPKLEDLRLGANVVARLLVEKPVRIQAVSYAPYATPNVFKQVVKEAVEEHCAKLPVKKKQASEPTIREWVVYLLATLCGFSNREAINLWNDRLGIKLNFPYTMQNADGLRGNSVTSVGDSHFSRDKADLDRRINHYRSTLTPARSSSS